MYDQGPDRSDSPVRALVLLSIGSFAMHITSPFFVVPLIVAVFAVCIFWGTSSKEDGHSEDDGHAAH
jgi:hypothetical protein